MKQQPIITEREQKTINMLPIMNLAALASVVRQNWNNVYFGAVPYLDAMAELNDIKDSYYMYSGKSVVLYFLANSNTWRGPIARATKAELNKRAKACPYS